ncbi:MAG: hypothetical protein K2H20_04880 [Bacilli bacterium]|nr:hypothetical protein [Bacilli bacterium]
MKKFVFLLLSLIITINISYAITEQDKAAIREKIDEAYRYYYYNPEDAARSRACDYVKDTYFFTYVKCKNNCEVESQKIKAKGNRATSYSALERYRQESNDYFYSCMSNNCNYIKDVQQKECYNYIEEYIQYKNKTRKK